MKRKADIELLQPEPREDGGREMAYRTSFILGNGKQETCQILFSRSHRRNNLVATCWDRAFLFRACYLMTEIYVVGLDSLGINTNFTSVAGLAATHFGRLTAKYTHYQDLSRRRIDRYIVVGQPSDARKIYT
jgi:hypothetical protein